ncbi:YndJ family transporter [Cerasicoccus maritimus]|uniref:YndJ family transporter n=1 Tax=Cerasicoccus maritimus TaxID=490089 RepID=UPI0028527B0E|nr:YndJ family transporter [Cerasicoccus maritimus]
MSDLSVILLLAWPTMLAIGAGALLLRRAILLPARLPEEFALAGAWVFVVGSLFWLGVFLSGSTFLGFGAPWTWLTAAHFAFAGFGALTVTALSCRVVSSRRVFGQYLSTASGWGEAILCPKEGN